MRSGSGYFKTSYGSDMAIFDTTFLRFWLGMFVAVLIALPFFTSNYMVHLVNLVALASIGALALNLLMGYAGLVSLGHAAFLASGAFTTVFVGQKLGLSFWLTVPAAGIVGAVVGFIAGLPALRLKALYLILSTIAIHFIVAFVVLEYQTRSGSSGGFAVPSPSLGFVTLDTPRKWYFFLLVVTTLVTVFSVNLVRSRIGRAWMAARDRDIAASMLGVNVAKYRLMAFALTSGLTAMAGSLGAYYLNYASAEQFTIWLGISYAAMVIVGGLGSVLGAFLGAAFITLMPYGISAVFNLIHAPPRLQTQMFAVQFALFGLFIIVFLLLEPQGFVGIWVRRIRPFFELWPFRFRRVIATVK